jgi:tyrosine-protein kinase Etk/Wzc
LSKDKDNSNNLNYNSGFSLVDILLIFIKHRKKIFIISGIACFISIILYFFVFDLIYFSEASIKSSSKSTSLLSGFGDLPDLGGLDDISLGGSKSAKELASYEEILLSRRCLEELITKFGFMERDKIEFMEDALKNFRENKLVIKIDKISGIMRVGFYDKDPELAKQCVEFLLQKLDKINIELNVTNARNNREFIEKRYLQAKEDLAQAEDSLKSFQIIYGVAPDLQTKASAQAVFTIESDLKAEEVKLDVLKKILSSDQPEVKIQEAKINSLKSKIDEIKNSTDISDLIRLGNSPQILLSYLRLQRNIEIQSKIIAFLLPLYEQAKIEEKRETPTVLILDTPVVAEKKSKPKRLTMVIVFTFFGFIFGIAYFIAYDKFIILKSNLKGKTS